MPVGTPAEASNVNITTTNPTTVLSGIIAAFDDADMPDSSRANVIGGQTTYCYVRGTANVTPGTACTSITVKVFDNAGIQIGPLRTVACTAGNNVEVPINVRDSGARQNNVYSVQLTCNAATGNSTVNDVIASADMPG